jgi:hypothetical protein
MADVVDTTSAPLRAQFSDTTDPVNVLLDLIERQVGGWRRFSSDDTLTDAVAELSWVETGALLRRFEPTTLSGVARALRHAVDRMGPDADGGSGDYVLPLARNAVSALERMVGA